MYRAVYHLKFPIYTGDLRVYTLKITGDYYMLRNLPSRSFPDCAVLKNMLANLGDSRDASLIPDSGRSPGVGKWQPAPVFLPSKSHGQRRLVSIVHGATKHWTRLSNWTHQEAQVVIKVRFKRKRIWRRNWYVHLKIWIYLYALI